jgi:hypothetical protein
VEEREGSGLALRSNAAWDEERVRNRTTVAEASPTTSVVGRLGNGGSP